MPSDLECDARLEVKRVAARKAVVSFVVAGLAFMAPVFISNLIRPAFNTPFPPTWAIFCEYFLPWICWLIAVPIFLVRGIVQVTGRFRGNPLSK